MSSYQQSGGSSGKDYGHGGSGGGSSNNNGNGGGQNNNNNSDYSKKEEFRRYLEKSGVLDAFTKVLVGLFEEPERPNNAIEYVKKYLGAPANVDIDGLKRENDQLKAEVDKLRRQLHQQNQHHHHHHHHSGSNNNNSKKE